MKHRDDRDSLSLNQKANDVRETPNKSLPHTAMRDRVQLGTAGDLLKRVVHAFDELSAELFTLLLVPLERF